ncbi:MAG: molybdopterin-dependent oxidoreductase, partial [Clostridiales bacterium]|nr:molybdopterin-dependent oxidoreductase [Clostridiales bacterium]
MAGQKHVFEPRVERDYIGTYCPRTDGLKKAAGRAQFTDDVTLKRNYPDMLYMRMLKSPYPHAKIKGIDSSAAEALPGVVSVLRYDDPEVQAFPSMPGAYNDAVGTLTRAQAWTAGLFDRRILGDHARWVGDELGIAIAATSEETVEEAMKLLKVEWEVLPFALTVEDAIKPDAPIIHPEINPDSNFIPNVESWGPDVFYELGDFDKAFPESEVTAEARASFNSAEQGALEYWSGMVDWNEEDEILVLSDSYGVDQTRWSLHEFFKVPLSKIRVITPYQGGQHGRADTHEQYFFYVCAVMSRRAGRPVKYRQTRREHFHDTRSTADFTIRLGATKEGRLTACEVEILNNQGAYFDLGSEDVKLVALGSWFESDIYSIPNFRAVGRGVYTNRIPCGCMRAVGNVQWNYILSIGIEAMAEELGMDPLDIYMSSWGSRAVPAPNPLVEEVLRKGAGIIGWENRRPHGDGGPSTGGRKKRGMGFAVGQTWHTEPYEFRRGPTQVMIKLNPDGTVILNAPTVEVGTGSNQCAVLACAESLGVEPDRITWIYYQDTDSGIKDQVQSDSAV